MPKESSSAYLSLDNGYLDDSGKQIEADTEEFHDWLQNNDSFRVDAGENSYRARKESYTGTDYWYGVKKVAGKLHKRFIGKTEEVTRDRLSAVADNIRQPSAKSTPQAVVQPVVQPVEQIDLGQKIVALEAQVAVMQQQLTMVLELLGKQSA